MSYILKKKNTEGNYERISPQSLKWAAETGQKDVLQSLCFVSTIPTEISQFNNDILATATAGGFDDVIEFLLQQDCDPNCENFDGMAEFHHTIAFGHRSTCEILFQYGADVHIKTYDQLLPIYISANVPYIPPWALFRWR